MTRPGKTSFDLDVVSEFFTIRVRQHRSLTTVASSFKGLQFRHDTCLPILVQLAMLLAGPSWLRAKSCHGGNVMNVRILCSLIVAAAALPVVAQAGTYEFLDVVNPGDVTFNQELGINNSATIAGYFGSGAPNATPPPYTPNPNQGYTYSAGSFTPENFPGSAQTQVTGINNAGTTVGFYADSNGATAPNFIGVVDRGGVFSSVTAPATPSTGPTTNQLLGIDDS
jgi:hypothetical protein